MSQPTPSTAAPVGSAAPKTEEIYTVSLASDGMPAASSTFAKDIDNVYWTWIYISIPFFLVVVGPMIYFAFKYKRKSEDEKTSPIDHHLRLEAFWTFIPAVVLIYMFWVGFKAYADASVPPNDAYEIKVTGQLWSWSFEYPDGTVTPELGIPKGRPVKLIMSSKDVIHSFFIPEFRAKQDVVPNLYTSLWFEATVEGTPDKPYETVVECAEYCGDQHSKMLTRVIVMPSGPEDKQGTFENWLRNGGLKTPLPPAQLGARHYRFNCSSCHTLDGSRLTGPSFKGLWGKQEKLADGSTVTVDENYVRESIVNPGAKIVDGYPNQMSAFPHLKQADIEGIIAFLKEQK